MRLLKLTSQTVKQIINPQSGEVEDLIKEATLYINPDKVSTWEESSFYVGTKSIPAIKININNQFHYIKATMEKIIDELSG